ncbi:MAG: DNA polymerase III, subunit gamma and tau [Bacteroidetes bacterium HGW-Bacteroidetes-2]|jgi:DNA polymerase-3 subunit gamma/tau|nr:MAG: DNA polymerase III, subunit gamma and tau [Bacteroidetes bacterium HGW-Bacteroidetes-2]
MEHFIVSARKYRPTTFKSVVGQQAITKTLENAIENNHLAQALLFTGPRGVGKTTCARILAKKINQKSTEDDPNEDFAFNIFELDAASNNSVDDIRNLTDQVRIPPQTGKYKVYIIDEVHMLSPSAFNAFLKTLEEPPNHAIFILATTEKHKIIPTILSRCQIFDFKRITAIDIKNHLAEIAVSEEIIADDDALHIIAQKADGALRDALSIFDRVVSFSGKNLTRQAVTENLNVLDYTTYFETTDFLLQNNIPKVLVLFDDILAKGFDGHQFISGLASHFRDLLVCRHPETISLLEVGDQIKTSYFQQAKSANFDFLIRAIDLANDCDLKYKSSKNQRLLVELCLMQLASIITDGEKKKQYRHIISPQHQLAEKKTHYLQTNSEKAATNNVVIEPDVSSNFSDIKENTLPYKEEVMPPKIENTSLEEKSKKLVNQNAERISAFSLKSIEKKKKLAEEFNTLAIDLDKPPEEAFTETDLQVFWNEYIKLLEHKGEHILASQLHMNLPVLKGNAIQVCYPNHTMKVELERSQQDLLNFLSKKLKNYSIILEIDVDEKAEKKYAYTPREKFEKLREKYPLIDTLRKTFDLDI